MRLHCPTVAKTILLTLALAGSSAAWQPSLNILSCSLFTTAAPVWGCAPFKISTFSHSSAQNVASAPPFQWRWRENACLDFPHVKRTGTAGLRQCFCGRFAVSAADGRKLEVSADGEILQYFVQRRFPAGLSPPWTTRCAPRSHRPARDSPSFSEIWCHEEFTWQSGRCCPSRRGRSSSRNGPPLPQREANCRWRRRQVGGFDRL